MKLTNDCYVISISTKNFRERYYRDSAGWLKVSARGRKFRMTTEQVLNHVLPALAGLKPGLSITVKHKASLKCDGGQAIADKSYYSSDRSNRSNNHTKRRQTCRNRSSSDMRAASARRGKSPRPSRRS